MTTGVVCPWCSHAFEVRTVITWTLDRRNSTLPRRRKRKANKPERKRS
jgi:hypothetical protein